MGDNLPKLYSYLSSQCQMLKDKEHKFTPAFVTISRQAGAGGITISEKLARHLSEVLPTICPWTVFDRDLIYEVIRENDFPKRIEAYLKESCVGEIEGHIRELLGVHPSQATLVERTSQTILRLARMGSAIIVGRGAPVITKFTPGGVHVRLVGSFKIRKEHIKEHFKFDDKKAEDFIKEEDRGRAEYLKKYFNRDIDDPLLYDLVINTDTVSYEDASLLIRDLVLRRIKSEEVTSV